MSEANPSIRVSASTHACINIVTLVIGAVITVDTGESHSRGDSNARIAPPVYIVGVAVYPSNSCAKSTLTTRIPVNLQIAINRSGGSLKSILSSSTCSAISVQSVIAVYLRINFEIS